MLDASPIKLHHSSLTNSCEGDDGDDGFLEIIDGSEAAKETAPLSGMENLFEAPVLNSKSSEHTPGKFRPSPFHFGQENKRSGSRRGLFRSPSLPGASVLREKSQSFDMQPRLSTKRSEPCHNDDTPVQYKRARNVRDRGTPDKVGLRLQRCHSETEAMIKTAISRSELEKDLIGDTSKPYCLPMVPGKKQDLKSISPDTVSNMTAQ